MGFSAFCINRFHTQGGTTILGVRPHNSHTMLSCRPTHGCVADPKIAADLFEGIMPTSVGFGHGLIELAASFQC